MFKKSWDLELVFKATIARQNNAASPGVPKRITEIINKSALTLSDNFNIFLSIKGDYASHSLSTAQFTYFTLLIAFVVVYK